MRYWLFKSEPGTWSWDDQVKAGKKGTEWDGVRNHQARQQMEAMEKGDLGFFYHSGAEKRIVGIVEVVAGAHADSTDSEGRWVCVDVAAVKPLTHPVSLEEIRRTPALGQMALVKNSRLSVQPVTVEEWERVLKMADAGI